MRRKCGNKACVNPSHLFIEILSGKWASREEAHLKECWQKGTPLAELGKEFPNRTREALRIKADKMGLRHSREQTFAIKSFNMSGTKNPFWGKPGINNGKTFSEETKAKISKAAIGGYRSGVRKPMVGSANPAFGKPSTMRGKHHTKEAREIISRKCLERWGLLADVEKDRRLIALNKGLQQLINGERRSSIECAVESWLVDRGVVFEANAFLGKYYSVDFAVETKDGKKIVIECNGDYWHAKAYPDYAKLNNMQKENIRRDRAKATYCSNRAINVLVLWERDINYQSLSSQNLLDKFLADNNIFKCSHA